MVIRSTSADESSIQAVSSELILAPSTSSGSVRAGGAARAAIQIGVTFLPAETLDFGDGDALNADGGQGFPHLVKLEWLDDCGYEFHECAPLCGSELRRARTCRGPATRWTSWSYSSHRRSR